MRKIIRSLCLLPFLALAIRPTVANAAEKTVSAKGYGEDDGAATKDALRVAVGLACGEGITTTSSSSSSSEKQITLATGQNTEKKQNVTGSSNSEIQATSSGFVKSYQLIDSGIDQGSGRTFVNLSAIVTNCAIPPKLNSEFSSQKYVDELRKKNIELMNIGNTDAIIINPKNLSQKYYNARILIQRGEVDRAVPIYEEIISDKLTFADPIIDLVTILTRLYGTIGAKRYIKDKLSSRIPVWSKNYAMMVANKNAYFDEPDYADAVIDFKNNPEMFSRFPPLAAIVAGKARLGFPSEQYDLATKSRKYDAGFSVEMWKLLIEASDQFKKSVDSGDFYAYYIDQIRAEKDLNQFSETAPFSSSAKLVAQCQMPVDGFDFYGGACVALGIKRDKPHYYKGDVQVATPGKTSPAKKSSEIAPPNRGVPFAETKNSAAPEKAANLVSSTETPSRTQSIPNYYKGDVQVATPGKTSPAKKSSEIAPPNRGVPFAETKNSAAPEKAANLVSSTETPSRTQSIPIIDESRGPIPKTPPASWFKLSDIPELKKAKGLQTSISYSLSVGVNGEVVGCRASESSAQGIADIFCGTVTSRAKFEPAQGQNGKPVIGEYQSAMRINVTVKKAEPKHGCFERGASGLAPTIC